MSRHGIYDLHDGFIPDDDSDGEYYAEIAMANAVEQTIGRMLYNENKDSVKEDCYWYAEEQDMNARIPYCKCKNKFPIGPEDCEHCELYHGKYKKTNADRIRSMTDEELTKFLAMISDFTRLRKECGYEWTRDDWSKWLKEEVRE